MTKKYIPVVENGICTDARKPLYPPFAVGSSFWFAWLGECDVKSFGFHCNSGNFTARKEERKGKAYWYAYKQVDNKLRKKYLGSSDQLIEAVLFDACKELNADPTKFYAKRNQAGKTEKQVLDKKEKVTSEFLKTELEQERERTNNLQKQLWEQKEQLTQLTQQLVDEKVRTGSLKQEIFTLENTVLELNKDKTKAEIRAEIREDCLTLPKVETAIAQLLKNKTITKTGKDRQNIKRAFDYLLTQLAHPTQLADKEKIYINEGNDVISRCERCGSIGSYFVRYPMKLTTNLPFQLVEFERCGECHWEIDREIIDDIEGEL